ncbi:MAG: c-type cytochrome [Gammaproteobacteria bacterium]
MGHAATASNKTSTAAGLLLGLVLSFAGTCAQAAISGPLSKAVTEGKHVFVHDTFGSGGMTCAACHRAAGLGPTVLPNGHRFPNLANAAAIFPRYKARAHKIVTLEDQIRGCVARGLRGKPPAYDSTAMRSLVAYITSLSQGKAIDMGGRPK